MSTSHPRRLTQAEFDHHYGVVPRACVDILIVVEEGILLTRRALPSWNGQWHLPGGTLLYGEFVEDAARRVARDELSVEIKIHRLVGYIQYPSKENGWPLSLVFLATMRDPGADIVLDHQATEYRFFDVLPDPMLEEHARFCRGLGDISLLCDSVRFGD
mgnify:FL=1